MITGASGFIGRHVVAELLRRSIPVRITSRQGAAATFRVEGVEVVGLTGPGTVATDWADAFYRCSTVIHLAARAHVLRKSHEDPVGAFQLANVDFTRACAEAASSAGVRRFIFMSSLGVHGGASGTEPLRVESAIKPHTAYARSKAEAERVLTQVVRRSDMELTVLRPPLVYGPSAPGNFGTLARAVARGCPLPLGLVTDNRRSFVAIDNLVDLIVTCLDHPAAANQTFLVSDGDDLSTADLLRRMGAAMGTQAWLLPIPVGWLSLVTRVLGKPEMFESLCDSLQVDMSKTKELLGWVPPIPMDEGLKRALGAGPKNRTGQ
jgi:nucleoside-diphosphate-sugar epimerase